jgi:hypothetical protein
MRSGQRRHGWLAGNSEATAEITQERDAQLGTGLGEAEEGVATIAPDIAAGATADLSEHSQ